MSEANPFRVDPIPGDPQADVRVLIAYVNVYDAKLQPDTNAEKKVDLFLRAAE